MYIFIIILLGILGWPTNGYTGGAVAATQKNQAMKGQQQQMTAQQQMMMQQEMMKRAAMQGGDQQPAEVPPEEVKAEEDFNEVLKTFEQSSQAWPLIIDKEPKVAIVADYIQRYQKQGVVITRSPEYYVQLIDGASQASPQMLQQPMETVLRIMAIIDYDFENGQNKDAMALKVLGSQQAFEENKKRLGL